VFLILYLVYVIAKNEVMKQSLEYPWCCKRLLRRYAARNDGIIFD